MNGDIATQSRYGTKERQVPLIFLLFSSNENIKYTRLYLDGPSLPAKLLLTPLIYFNGTSFKFQFHLSNNISLTATTILFAIKKILIKI